MRKCQLALKHTTWKAQWQPFGNRMMNSMLRLASRTRALWGKVFYPSPMHAHSSPLVQDASLAPAMPTLVGVSVSEGERNPKKVGPCIDRERWIEKTKFQWNMIFESQFTPNQCKDKISVCWGMGEDFLSKCKRELWKEQCRCANWCSYLVF